jgi:RNA recognition motif-containing protein
MANKLFIGNLAWEVGADELKEHFSQFGEVTDAFVATDKFSGRSRGFGFVTFADESAVAPAKELHGTEFMGRDLVVDSAQEQQRD